MIVQSLHIIIPACMSVFAHNTHIICICVCVNGRLPRKYTSMLSNPWAQGNRTVFLTAAVIAPESDPPECRILGSSWWLQRQVETMNVKPSKKHVDNFDGSLWTNWTQPSCARPCCWGEFGMHSDDVDGAAKCGNTMTASEELLSVLRKEQQRIMERHGGIQRGSVCNLGVNSLKWEFSWMKLEPNPRDPEWIWMVQRCHLPCSFWWITPLFHLMWVLTQGLIILWS